MDECEKLAAAIDKRVREAEAAGYIGGAFYWHAGECIGQLRQLHDMADQDALTTLMARHPALERLALMLGDWLRRGRAKASLEPYDQLGELPDALRTAFVDVLHDAADVERRMHSIRAAHDVDAASQLKTMLTTWAAEVQGIRRKLHAPDVQPPAAELAEKFIKRAAGRIEELAYRPLGDRNDDR